MTLTDVLDNLSGSHHQSKGNCESSVDVITLWRQTTNTVLLRTTLSWTIIQMYFTDLLISNTTTRKTRDHSERIS